MPTQRDLMNLTSPGARIRKQLETAEKMGLTKEDVKKLQRKFPDRYYDLAVAFGLKPYKEASSDTVQKAAFKLAKTDPKFRKALLDELRVAKLQDVPNQDLRHAFYTSVEGVADLEGVVRQQFRKDSTLRSLVRKVDDSLSLVMRHLNANYNWD